MKKMNIILLITVSLLTCGFAGCLIDPSGSGPVVYETWNGYQQPHENYLGDPENGNILSSNTFPVKFSVEDVVSATFRLTWTDDAPDSEPDEMTLHIEEVRGGARSRTRSSTSGEILVVISSTQDDEFLSAEWTVTISIANCGETPAGQGSSLPIPDEGNSFTFNVDYSYRMATRDSKAPDFNITDISGEELSLARMRGKVVLLDLMATWCDTCEKMLPTLRSLYEKYNDSLVIISISVSAQDNLDKMRTYAEEHDTPWYHAFDTDYVGFKYNVDLLPRFVIIDTEGYVAFIAEGLVSSEDFSRSIDASIAGTNPTIGLERQSIYFTAFMAGLLAFFAPCALPLLPGYAGYYICQKDEGLDSEEGENESNPRFLMKGIRGGVAAALGIITLYLGVGILAGAGSEFIMPFIPFFGPIMGILLIFFGFVMIRDISLPTYKITAPIRSIISKAAGKGKDEVENKMTQSASVALYKYGLGYGAASAGCVAPVFLMIIFTALSMGGFVAGLTVLLIYGIAMAILMVVFTVIVSMAKDAVIKKVITYMDHMRVVGGFFMMVGGLFLLFWYFIV